VKEKVFIDTSAFYAVADKGDVNHTSAVVIYKRLLDEAKVLTLTDYVLSETATLVRRRLGYKRSLEFLDLIEEGTGIGLFETIIIGKGQLADAKAIFAGEKDPKFSFVDAVSISTIRREKIKKVFAFDSHFTNYGCLKP
jgi:predicted nucleic acid-binding protein